LSAPGRSAPPQGFGPHWLLRQQLGGPGVVCTFYSYKGGTGRSMGLVNCAGLIAQHLPRGAKPLLLVDFDLEAPGLQRYLAPLLGAAAASPHRGVIDLFEDLATAIDAACCRHGLPALDDERAMQVVADFDFSPYKQAVHLPGAAPDAPAPMELITAGRFDDDYDARLQRFDWPGLHRRAPALFRALSARWAAEYSFVFVDSRTGLSDTSGICTTLLPDVLVVVFTPNAQSLTGIGHLVRKAVAFRAGAPDSRPLRVYPLPSRVDNQVEHFRQVWRLGDPQHGLFGPVQGYQPLFADVLALVAGAAAGTTLPLGEYFDQVQVPHAADYAFGERLCFGLQGTGDSLSIRNAYELFLPWLVTGAQPWQRPADMLLDLRAKLWLRDAGVAEAPPADDWPAWFDRLSRLAAAPELNELIASPIAPDRRFDIALARSLAHAHVGEYTAARAALGEAAAAISDESAPSLLQQAPAALLQLLRGEQPPPRLQAEAAAWLDALDRLMASWQPLRAERQRWLEAMLPLAGEWRLAELQWRAAREIDGHLSERAAAALVVAARARYGAGDVAGAVALMRVAVASTSPDDEARVATVRRLLSQLSADTAAEAPRPLPAIADCEFLAWISYARADDQAWSDGVQALRLELDRGIRASLRGLRLPPVVGAETVLAGSDLAEHVHERLQASVARSFCFILIAGEATTRSEWCQRETAAFLRLYGRQSIERLYIVAVSRPAAEQVLAWPLWQEYGVAESLVYARFYSEEHPTEPVPVYLGRGVLNPAFHEAFTRLRDHLALAIRRSAEQQPARPAAVAAAAPHTDLAAPATVYIESNRHERSLWQPIGELLRLRWQALNGHDDVPPISLRVRGLPIDAIDQVPLDDADGLVLLWGRKTPDALVAQINRVESRLGATVLPPGIVAYLSPPQPPADEPVPAWAWPVARLSMHDESAPAIHDDDTSEIDAFLRRVSEVVRRRTAGP
jgi:hypothetical protein